MALIKSQTFTQASGSVGGTTYSRSRGGMYMRARAMPVNPNTGFQGQVKSALTELVVAWSSILTAAERAAWDLYGDNTLTTNALGDVISLSGQNWYIASNTPRLQANAKLGTALPRVDIAPSIFDRGDFSTPTLVSLSVLTGLTFTVDPDDDWASEDASALLVYQGRPRNAGRTFFNGPWRLVARLPGDSTSPPEDLNVSSAEFAAHGYPLVQGQRIRYEVAVTRPDGRLSTRRTLADVLVAA